MPVGTTSLLRLYPNAPTAITNGRSTTAIRSERWSKGRATLLGDSAHAMLPYLGQGAGMAIEDGYVLAAMVERQRRRPRRGAARYEKMRAAARDRRRARLARRAPGKTISPRRWARLRRDVKFALRDRFGADKTAFKVGLALRL